ncbi:MAG: SDR family NAD(P)-dependent oxidoreductase [Actinobacteria bacterium]|nr:SDR family NAD(P)-dependent oxidoreductase [Actinomycetota bacterium]
MTAVVWITGASSGIGAALAEQAPADALTIGVARRPPARGRHLPADLADPNGWEDVCRAFAAVLDEERPARAILHHFAGVMTPIGPAADVDLGAYRDAVLLNAAAGQVLGAGFLAACAERDVPATVVFCSSPAARAPRAGASQYCAGKAALEHWIEAVALEQEGSPRPARLLTAVPWGVDTAMVREAMDAPSDRLPLGEVFRTAAAAGTLASPTTVAREIWAATEGDRASGSVFDVGAVPETR